jgi:peptidoglycan/xylan/chitin deacetylase (PgdA/CDA1 family)
VGYALPAGVALSPAAGLVGVHRRTCSKTSVALTFDDGPQPGITDRFVELLGRLSMHATFFLVGEHVRRFPGLVREICAAGHEVANHGYWHRNHLLRNPLSLFDDVRQGAETIEDALGEPCMLFRPPYGVATAATLMAAFRQHSAVVLWSAGGRDWRDAATVESITQEVLRTAGPGGIILLHDADYYRRRTWHATYQAVPIVVEQLRDRGLTVGPVGGPASLGL